MLRCSPVNDDGFAGVPDQLCNVSGARSYWVGGAPSYGLVSIQGKYRSKWTSYMPIHAYIMSYITQYFGKNIPFRICQTHLEVVYTLPGVVDAHNRGTHTMWSIFLSRGLSAGRRMEPKMVSRSIFGVE